MADEESSIKPLPGGEEMRPMDISSAGPVQDPRNEQNLDKEPPRRYGTFSTRSKDIKRFAEPLKEAEKESFFKSVGGYRVARMRDVRLKIGRDSQGFRDFRGVIKPEVRKHLIELRDKFFPATQGYVREDRFKIQSRREIDRRKQYATGDELVALHKFEEELKDKHLL